MPPRTAKPGGGWDIAVWVGGTPGRRGGGCRNRKAPREEKGLRMGGGIPGRRGEVAVTVKPREGGLHRNLN